MKKFEIENRYFLRAVPPNLETYKKVQITHYYLNPFFDVDVLTAVREAGIRLTRGFTLADLRTLVGATPDKGFRVTKRDDKFFLAFKGRSDKNYHGKKRLEIESEETSSALVEEFIFRRFTRGAKQISKTRYFVPLTRELTAELDFFAAPFQHLRLVEVEFRTEAEGNAFTPPQFFGLPATKISNRKLAHEALVF